MADKKTTKKTAARKTTAKKTTANKAAAKKPAPKKTAAKKAAPKSETTTRRPAKKATKHPRGKKPAREILHYDKEVVVAGYTRTYKIMMLATAISVGFIFLYFMVFVVYLGGFSHSKHDPFYEKFNDRIDLSIDYDGKPLPKYEQQQ